MAEPQGTFEALALELGRVFLPLQTRLAEGNVKELFTDLGLTIPASTPLPAPVVTSIADVIANVIRLPPLIVQLEQAIEAEDTAGLVGAGIALVENVTELVLAIQAMATAMNGSSGSFPGVQPADVTAFAGVLATRLAEYALLTYLEGYWPKVSVGLRALGLVDLVRVPGVDDTKPPHMRRTLHLERLGDLLTDPIVHFQTVYGWDSPAFDAQRLLEVVHDALFLLTVPSKLEPIPPANVLNQLVIAPFRFVPEPTASPRGFSLRFDTSLAASDLGFQIPIPGTSWNVGLAVDGALGPSVGLLVQPPLDVSVVPSGGIDVKLSFENKPATPIVVLAIDANSRIQLDSFNFYVEFKTPSDIGIGAGLKGGRIIIDTSGSDGFLQKLLSGVHIDSNFDLGIGFSTDDGFRFEGSATLEIQLASHISLGPIEITALTIIVGIQPDGFPIGLAVDLKAELGPLKIIVEGIGFEVTFALASDNQGNLGPVELTPGFRPPRGAGLSIDTGIVKGGGYLFFDPDNGEYAGVAELSIAELVTVKAIGLITTKMPDGSEGFSLLLIITAEFQPIQLGFGFTLIGVGGLLGLNRAVLLDVLREGVRTGAVNSIMFPTDVVANAPRIISDLKAIFPPEEGTFLIGPMAKFGWGTPTLISLSLGIILEIPPGNIAILGVLKVALPDESTALIKIQVSFVGILDFEKQMLSFDASLFDSRVLFMTLEGDMAVRLKWGDNAAFILSVGGFHPAFVPPEGLALPATMRRLTISILDTDWARIRIENYFAITSNTVQFGAHAYLFFGFSAANINGEIGFDVLFQFSPFYFIAMITGSLAIEVFGLDLLSIRLRFSLEGPTPWRAKGTGSISILFFSIDIDFDTTWGDQADTALPPISVMPLFVAEIEKPESLRALPPPSSNLLVSLRTTEEGALVLHPFGALAVTQRAMPLAVTLDKIGSQKPDDVSRIDITQAVSGTTALSLTPVDESFAVAQFQKMDDSEKLSRPSYQSLKGGVIVGTASTLQTSKMTRRQVAYDITIIDKEPQKPLPRGKLFGAIAGLFRPFLAGNAVTKSSLSKHVKTQLEPFAEKIAVAVEGFTVARISDNKALSATARFTSEAMARDHLRSQIAANPALADELHVISDYEVAA
jgi:hypothetical protein